MEQHEKYILTYAYKKGVAIHFANDCDSIWEEGVHVFQPTLEEVWQAVSDAVKHGCKLVMIHESKKTWPFSFRY